MKQKTLFTFGLSALLLTVGCGGDDGGSNAQTGGGTTDGGTTGGGTTGGGTTGGGTTGGGTETQAIKVSAKAAAQGCRSTSGWNQDAIDGFFVVSELTVQEKSKCLYFTVVKGENKNEKLKTPTGWKVDGAALVDGACSGHVAGDQPPAANFKSMTGEIKRVSGVDDTYFLDVEVNIVATFTAEQAKTKSELEVTLTSKGNANDAVDISPWCDHQEELPMEIGTVEPYSENGSAFILGVTPDEGCVVMGLGSTALSIPVASGPTMTSDDGDLHYHGWMEAKPTEVKFFDGKCKPVNGVLPNSYDKMAKNKATGSVRYTKSESRLNVDVVLGGRWKMKAALVW